MGYQFYHMLLHISKRAKDAGYTMMEDLGINPGQAWLLDVVSRFGPIKQVETASILNVKLPAVSRMVKGMQRDGLVNRDRSKVDDRIVLLTLSAKGESFIPAIRDAWNNVEEEMMKGFSKEEKQQFKQHMVKAATNLSEL